MASAASGPVGRLSSVGSALNNIFKSSDTHIERSFSIVNPAGGFYHITFVYTKSLFGKEKIVIKTTGNISNCVILDINPDNIYLASLLYTIHNEFDPCKQIDGATYLNLVLAVCKVYTRQVLNIDGSLKNKYIKLTDAAEKSLAPGLRKVELSLFLLLEKGRTYYEGYGFLPIFIIDNDESNILPFDSDEYLLTLDAFLKYRNGFILEPISTLERMDKFEHGNYSLIESDNIKANRYIATELFKLSNDSSLSINDIYTRNRTARDKTEFLRMLGYNQLNIIGSLCSNYKYIYPILTGESRERIMRIYEANGIDTVKSDYAFFILSDNLHGPSGNVSGTKRIVRTLSGREAIENVQPHVDPFVLLLETYMANLSPLYAEEEPDLSIPSEELEKRPMLPNIELDDPLEGPPTGAIIRGKGKGKGEGEDKLRKSRKKSSMERRHSRERHSRSRTPTQNSSSGEYSNSSSGSSTSGSGRGRRSRKRSPPRTLRSGEEHSNSSSGSSTSGSGRGRRSRSRAPLRAMPSNLYKELVRSPGGYYSPPGSPGSPRTPSAN